MASAPMIHRSSTALIVVDEPAAALLEERGLTAVGDGARALAEAADIPFLDLREALVRDQPFLIDTHLTERVAELGRRSIILTGGLLEGAVTQIALASILDGFDIFICVDLVCSAEHASVGLFLDRLKNYGADVVTKRQIALEMLSQEPDDWQRKALQDLIILTGGE